jgi:hypothetical protein
MMFFEVGASIELGSIADDFCGLSWCTSTRDASSQFTMVKDTMQLVGECYHHCMQVNLPRIRDAANGRKCRAS